MLWTMMKDPVVWGSLLGIGIIVAMMMYYTYLFMHNSADEDKISHHVWLSRCKLTTCCFEAVCR